MQVNHDDEDAPAAHESALVPLTKLERRVSQGLAAGEFHLAFQGIYQVSTGELSRIEALIRWMHPDYGLLLPEAFLVVLKNPQVALELTYFVIDSVCCELGHAMRDGQTVCPIAINVPPSVAAHAHFAGDFENIARSHGVSMDMLEIELAESEDAARILASKSLTKPLRESGISLAIDDFGTGYSSLALLSAFDVDTVKLAREVLGDAPLSERAAKVVAGILSLLEGLGVFVVVEGVETKAQAQWLAQWPNVLVQGYFYSRPMLDLARVPGHVECVA
ncbi:MAG TPA: EAL domain-containing protein [Paraburkholderia sp.]|nr:EAL domain-containing protein [Paraburkholderia sp.]